MKSLTIFVISLVILSLSGCVSNGADTPQNEVKAFSAADTAEAREILLGKWYGEKRHDDGTFQKWLVNRLPDGTYLIEFHVKE